MISQCKPEYLINCKPEFSFHVHGGVFLSLGSNKSLKINIFIIFIIVNIITNNYYVLSTDFM